MNTLLHRSLPGYGLGQSSTADTAVKVGSQAAASVLSLPTVLGNTVGTMLGVGATAAIPIIGAAVAAVSLGIEAILHSGCGQTCVVTSQWANQAEPHLQQNISAYFAINPPRPRSVQQIALANFDAVWNTLVQQCNQPGLGDAGQNCINDRQSGACKWHATSQTYPGSPAVGACWNWFNGYRDPIANDTQVYNDGGVTSAASGAAVSGTSGFDPTLLMIGGGILLLLFMVRQV